MFNEWDLTGKLGDIVGEGLSQVENVVESGMRAIKRVDRTNWPEPPAPFFHSEVAPTGREYKAQKPLRPGDPLLHYEVPHTGREHKVPKGWSPLDGLLRSEVAPVGRENDVHRLPGRPRIGGGIVKIDRMGRRIRGTDPTRTPVLLPLENPD